MPSFLKYNKHYLEAAGIISHYGQHYYSVALRVYFMVMCSKWAVTQLPFSFCVLQHVITRRIQQHL